MLPRIHLAVNTSDWSLSLRWSAICLNPHRALKRSITCEAQKQDPTLPHVYSTGRLLVEVLDTTKVAIRAQGLHSRSLNLASLPISRIVIITRRYSRIRARWERRERKKRKESTALYIPRLVFPLGSQVYSIAIDRVPGLYTDRGDRSSTEVRARLKPPLPFRLARTFARSASLREEFSRTSPIAPDVNAIIFWVQGAIDPPCGESV